jgi:hypothetical protein
MTNHVNRFLLGFLVKIQVQILNNKYPLFTQPLINTHHEIF